jgi:REP element-mobilizing transposase RayT
MHKYAYWRTLPHIQKANRPLFVTFSTYKRWVLAPLARRTALDCCIDEHGGGIITLHAAVVMPDHVHLIFTPLADVEGWPYRLPDIMRKIKGRSARGINLQFGRQGAVWQDESFDHVLRSNESLAEKVDYVRMNPFRAGLVNLEERYPWLWQGPIPLL